MKTFKQFVSESVKTPGTLAHFSHHAKAYMNHQLKTDMARSARSIDDHFNKTKEHHEILTKHYGAGATDHIHIDGGDDEAIKAAFRKLKK